MDNKGIIPQNRDALLLPVQEDELDEALETAEDEERTLERRVGGFGLDFFVEEHFPLVINC